MSSLRICFAAFEPSGDRLASAVITALRTSHENIEFEGYGGSLMQQAGCNLFESTCEHAVMGLDILPEVPRHLRRLKAFKKRLRDNPPDLFVAVDSPAANWSMCKAVRKYAPQTRIAHLVMPQVWAWANWRMKRLQRLSDLVLCLLPFEQKLCEQQGIPAVFVGHPAFEELTRTLPPAEPNTFPQGQPHLAVLAGSRRKELQRNLPVFSQAVELLRKDYPDLAVALCLRADRDIERAKSAMGGSLPEHFTVLTGLTQQAFEWCDAALVKSGTSTLEAAARDVPHVMAFITPRIQFQLIARPLLSVRSFALPNLIGQSLGLCDGPVGGTGRIVPELCPNYRDPIAIADSLRPLLQPDSKEALAQREAFAALRDCLKAKSFAKDSAEALEQLLAN